MSKKTEKYYQWKKSYYEKRRENTTNGRKKWLEQDINLLFEFKGTDSELSKVLNRSVQSIQVKRSKIIKAEDSKKDVKKDNYFKSSYIASSTFGAFHYAETRVEALADDVDLTEASADTDDDVATTVEVEDTTTND